MQRARLCSQLSTVWSKDMISVAFITSLTFELYHKNKMYVFACVSSEKVCLTPEIRWRQGELNWMVIKNSSYQLREKWLSVLKASAVLIVVDEWNHDGWREFWRNLEASRGLCVVSPSQFKWIRWWILSGTKLQVQYVTMVMCVELDVKMYKWD